MQIIDLNLLIVSKGRQNVIFRSFSECRCGWCESNYDLVVATTYSPELCGLTSTFQATGNVGSTFAKALVQHGKHTVTGIVRKGSKGSVPDGVKRIEAVYDSEQSMIAALSGQQFLVITLSTNALDDMHKKIVQAAAKAGVRYIMPNSFSNDIRDEALVREDLYSTITSSSPCDVDGLNRIV